MASPVDSIPRPLDPTILRPKTSGFQRSTRNSPDNDMMGPTNRKIALIALAAGLIGSVVVGFKTGLVCAVIAGGLAYRSHHPEAFKGAEAHMTKWVSDVKAYFTRTVEQAERTLQKALPKPKSRLELFADKVSKKLDKAHETLNGITMAIASAITP